MASITLRIARILVLFMLASSLVPDALPAYAGDGERILDFHSDITVNPDSTMTVTETIRVRAERASIKHGIYRDFPTRYEKESGGEYLTAFDVERVTCDGEEEENFTKRLSNGVRLYIGKKDELVSRGVHTYGITYGTDRQVGMFDTHDELYWNVTGNDWMFPIDRASAVVHLPEGASASELSAYTGRMGVRGADYTSSSGREGTPEFASTRPLDPYEGMTIVVQWPKGFVSEPDAFMRARYFVRDNLYMLVAVFGTFIVLAYYLYAWFKVGRDPEKGHIMVRYEPPDQLSPAAMRYIMKHGFDSTGFTAAIVNLAVKGFVRIDQTGKRKYALEKVEGAWSGLDSLPEGERVLLGRIFGGKRRIELGKYESSVNNAMSAITGKLKPEYSTAYFLHNTGYFMPGVGLTALTIWALSEVGEPGFLASAPLVGLCAVFYFLIKAPTVTGRRAMDRIEGFRMYLKAVEEDRFNRMNPPEKTPELFEKYLPYAIALDCENEWAEQFTGKLMESAIAERTGTWYHSDLPFARGFAVSMSDSLASSFSGAISSSATPPSSSSGGGGGGSSGGGGGGGGGGGW